MLNNALKGLAYGTIAGAVIIAVWYVFSAGPMSFFQNRSSEFVGMGQKGLVWIGLYYYTIAGAIVGAIVGFIVGLLIKRR